MTENKLILAIKTPLINGRAERSAYKKRQQKMERMKHYELIGYRIAYYLLQNEQLAQQAVKLTLRELYENEHFFAATAAEQDQLLQKCCKRHAIRLHTTFLQRSKLAE